MEDKKKEEKEGLRKKVGRIFGDPIVEIEEWRNVI